jgi:hypothetical protein
MIKGANMSFRTCAIGETRFDRRLKGKGAQGNEDMCFSIAIRNKGWRCVYDPKAIVEHYVGRGKEARPYGLVESGADTMRFREFAYNEVVGVWDALTPLQRCAFFLWSVFVGTGVCPGLVQAMRYTRQLGYESWRRFGIAQQGKLDAFRDLLFA